MIMIYEWHKASAKDKKRILTRSQANMEEIKESVQQWIEKVKKNGDDALVEYVRTFDNPTFTKQQLRVTKKDIEVAYKKVPPKTQEIIKRQISISRRFHEAQKKQGGFMMEIEPGVIVGQKSTPLDSAGLTVPAGQVPLPTVMQILTIAAKVAGVPRVIACSPPTGPHYEMLIAADIAGTDELYRVGGIAGIAAMAYGTETIKPVVKIVGPGSVYTQAAKLQVYGHVDIDMLSGPSEALILADETANPAWCAADILARCEHDQNATGVLVTTSMKLAKATQAEIIKQLPKLKRKKVAEVALNRFSALIVCRTMEECVDLANLYSTEHLEVQTQDPWSILPRIKHAGSIFLGHYAPVAVGDYASGTNHCLPTGRWPQMTSPININTFRKESEFQYLTKEGIQNLWPIIDTLTDVESLDGHKKSVAIRLKK